MDSVKNIPLSWAHDWLQQPKRQYIDGQWVDGTGQDKWVVTNPANREALCEFVMADAEQVEYAAQIANQRHESGAWSKVSRTQRAEMLRFLGQIFSIMLGHICSGSHQVCSPGFVDHYNLAQVPGA